MPPQINAQRAEANAKPNWDINSLRRSYGKFFLGSARLDRWVHQTGWPLTELVIGFAKGLKANGVMLDAGAGWLNNRPAFNHCRYEACDIAEGDEGQNIYSSKPSASFFVSDLTSIPRSDRAYDGILCTQVLEHVPQPQVVVSELARVLKPTGVLCLTTNGTYGIHMPPFHFYNTTPFSLMCLFEKAGLELLYMAPRGGWFNMVGGTLPRVIDEIFRGPRCRLVKPFIIPFSHILIPMLCSNLDRFDQEKRFSESWDIIACRKGAKDSLRFDPAHLPSRMLNPKYQAKTLMKKYPALQSILHKDSPGLRLAV